MSNPEQSKFSDIDSEILVLTTSIVEYVDSSTKHYLSKILKDYKQSKSDKDILISLQELKEFILDKTVIEEKDDDEEEPKMYIILAGERIPLKSLTIYRAEQHYDFNSNKLVHDISIGGYKIISYLSAEARDKDIKRIDINHELFNNIKFISG